MNQQPFSVIDIFCGAGGFSQGFKQEGFDIVMGIDNWQPAINTFNYNFTKTLKVKNVLDFEKSLEEINSLPDSDIIIGSPPCISFSSSNKSGKADKAIGMKLIYAFFRVIAVKKYQANSILKAWFMENVANSQKYLPETITFSELDLEEFALDNNIKPNSIALRIKSNTVILNSADYGSFQARKRAITGELIETKKLIVPQKTHSNEVGSLLKPHKTLGELLDRLPSPFAKQKKNVVDPNYDFSIEKSMLTDHFYDTGIYECDWAHSKFMKTNHPYMGKMSFPERLDTPCRTITATKISNSREAIILKSEFLRTGNGEFRTLTVREAACAMSFPITYQFIGSENTKWRLVGNAVCPKISTALANTVLEYFGKKITLNPSINEFESKEMISNLNSSEINRFEIPKQRNKESRFRRHPFKDGNITVTLSNYDVSANSKKVSCWQTSIQYGTGEGFPSQFVPLGFYKEIETILSDLEGGKHFVSYINNGFSEKIAGKEMLQEMYEKYEGIDDYLEPTKLIEYLAKKIESLDMNKTVFEQDKVEIFKYKKRIPVKQLFALYAINKIASIAENT